MLVITAFELHSIDDGMCTRTPIAALLVLNEVIDAETLARSYASNSGT